MKLLRRLFGQRSSRQRVLAALADERWHRGVELADAVDGVGRARVYAELAALQRDGVIEARWMPGPNPRGREFRLRSVAVAGSADAVSG